MPRLVNLGSLCIDHVYSVEELARAGETLTSSRYQIFPGGKGLNQSLAAARAGARVVHVGCVGSDGTFLIEVLREAGVGVGDVRVDPGLSTGHAVIQVNARGENAIVIAGGANRRIGTADRRAAFDQLRRGDWLLLQNEINDLPIVLEGAAAGRRAGVRVAFNLAPADGGIRNYDLEAVDLLIVNCAEACALLDSTAGPSTLLADLGRRWPALTVVLTLGRDGLLYLDRSGGGPGTAGKARNGADPIGRMPAFEVAPVDETAAGDAFIGYLMAELLRGSALTGALRVASAAGALAVTVAGAASSIPEADAVRELLGLHGPSAPIEVG